MKNKLEKKPGITTYIQVKEFLQKKIISGELKTGERLPTERELANEFGISRTTVSTACKYLKEEGYIETMQGRGTFVRESLTLPINSRKEQLIDSIDETIDKALHLGFTFDDVQNFVNLRIFEYKFAPQKINVVFIDCNKEQTYLFAKRMASDPQVKIQTILLHDLINLRKSSIIKNADLIVTTIRHAQEVKKIINKSKILSIATTPYLEGLINISNLLRKEKVGLVSSGYKFKEIFERAMNKANISVDNVSYYNEGDNLDDFIHSYSSLIVTPLMEKQVRSFLSVSDKMYIIPFYFEMDAGSVNVINEKLVELKSRKRHAVK